MTQDDRMETITDPAEIRATSDERGCCDCRTFDQHERECILPDERTTPAPVGAAVALDLDALHETICDNFTGMAEVRQAADALIAAVRALTAERDAARAEVERLHEEVHAGNVRGDSLNAALEEAQLAVRQLCARAEAAEAEVVTLRAKVAAVQALAEKRDVLYPPKWAFGAEENYCNGYRQARADFIAAMATGEGK